MMSRFDRCAPRSSPSRPWLCLGAAVLAACGADPAKFQLNLDAAPGLDAQTACQQDHLVCGRLGADSCGTCEFTATCLPDQTGCTLTTRLVAASSLLPDLTAIITVADFTDRRIVLSGTSRRQIDEISDAGAVTQLAIDSAGQPKLKTLGDNAGAVFWALDDGTLWKRPLGGPTASFTNVTVFCDSLAASDSYLLCSTTTNGNAIIRYSLSTAIADSVLATTGVVDVRLHGTTGYYISDGGGPLAMFNVTTMTPIAVTGQLPAVVSALYGVTGDSIVVRAGAASTSQELWRISLDGATAERLSSLDRIEVIGLAQVGPVVRDLTDPLHIGVFSLATKAIDTLLAHADYDIRFATSRGGELWFTGTDGIGGQFLIKLTR